MYFLACVVWRSRLNLLAVSLPSPAFIAKRPQPKPPCYAGYVYFKAGKVNIRTKLLFVTADMCTFIGGNLEMRDLGIF